MSRLFAQSLEREETRRVLRARRSCSRPAPVCPISRQARNQLSCFNTLTPLCPQQFLSA